MYLTRYLFLEILTFYHFGFLMYLHIPLQPLYGIKLLKKILTESSNKNDKHTFLPWNLIGFIESQPL